MKRLPLDELKIDRSFVRDVTTDANDASLVATIIAMARSFYLDVVAEGLNPGNNSIFCLKTEADVSRVIISAGRSLSRNSATCTAMQLFS